MCTQLWLSKSVAAHADHQARLPMANRASNVMHATRTLSRGAARAGRSATHLADPLRALARDCSFDARLHMHSCVFIVITRCVSLQISAVCVLPAGGLQG